MEKKTLKTLEEMRSMLIDFLHISNTIPSLDWVEVVRAIQQKQNKLRRVENLARLGNIFVMIFFIAEIIEEIVDNPPK